MNKWKKLLAMLKAGQAPSGDDPGFAGYAGDENDLTAVKAFIADNNIDLSNETDGKAFDLDAAHKANTRRAVKVDDTPIPAKHVHRDPTSPAARGDSPSIHVHAGKSFVGSAKKSYENRAATNGVGPRRDQTKFADAECAEFFGAALRLGFATRHHITAGYSQRTNDEEIIEKSGSSFNPTTGGSLIPDEYRAQLIYLKEFYGVARRVANVVPMSRDHLDEPRITAVNAMVPIGELPAMSIGDDSTDLVGLTAKEWGRLARFPNALLEDAAISVVDIFTQTAVEAQTKAEDQCYFLGDGTAAYNNDVGLANALPTGAFIAASGNAWSAVTEPDINKLIGSVENVDITRCGFLTSRQYYAQVMQPMYTSNGRGFQSEFRSMFGLTSGGGAEWKGWPVMFVQVMPTSSGSAQKGLYFGDYMAASMLGDRRDLTVATSEHAYFTSNAFGVRATSRFTVNVHGDGRGSTVGPIACLKTT